MTTLRHELRQLLYSPLTYLFQIVFLLGLSAGVFLIADFYSSDEASARLLLVFLPWVAVVLVPALCAQAWVDEPGDRSMELVATLPVSVAALVVGKFLAIWSIALVTLAFTAPFAVTLYWLGEPDGGVLAAGYVGAAALLAVYVAVALFMASLVREQVSALVLGIGALFVLLILGWDVFRQFVRALDMPALTGLLLAMSPKTWMDSMSAGVIRAPVLAAFAGVTSVVLFATAWSLSMRKRVSSGLRGHGGAPAMVLGAFVIAGLCISERIGSTWFVDLTAEKEFTLGAGTRSILHRLPEPVTVTLYWSESQPDVPASIRAHAVRVRDLLNLIAAHSAGKIRVVELDPAPDTDTELEAAALGVHRVPMTSGDHFYLGAVFRQDRRRGRIPYFDNRRERLLEYDVMVALNGLSKARIPRIGIISPLVAPSAVDADPPGLSFLSELKQAYDIAIVPYFKEELPDGLDVLVVIAAGILRRNLLQEIDAFVSRGGSLIVLVDPYLRLHRASNQVTIGPSENVDDISDLLAAYGLIYRDNVIGDAELGAPVSHQSLGTLSYPYWLRVAPEQLSSAHPVTASLNELLFAEPGEFEMTQPAAQALVRTGNRSGTQPRDRFAESEPADLAAGFVPQPRQRVIAAVVPAGDVVRAFGPASSAPGNSVVSDEAGIVFAVADVDWIYDTFSLQTVDLEGGKIVRPLNDNYAFFLNMVEYATGDPALLSIRSRGRLQRTFTLVEDRFKNAEKQYRARRAELTASISQVETRIAQFLKQAGVDDVARLPAADQDRLLAIQRELLPLRRDLREVRLRIRSDIEALGNRVTAFNLSAGPLLVIIFAGWMFARRRRGQAVGVSSSNRPSA